MTDSGASASGRRASELQQQLEALLARIREAQRQAELARQRALEAQKRAQEAQQRAEKAQALADRTRKAADVRAAQKAQQDYKLEDARYKKESAAADMHDKEVKLLQAKVKQTREQIRSPSHTSSAAADKKVSDAQADFDRARKTDELSRMHADWQEAESKAFDSPEDA
ncbi:MAG: hypothetical protein ACJ8H8_24800, partial [Geminicoccaceae bacterium]